MTNKPSRGALDFASRHGLPEPKTSAEAVEMMRKKIGLPRYGELWTEADEARMDIIGATAGMGRTMNNVVSFSGGHNSAYLVYLIEKMRESERWEREIGGDVEYIFMDTGAEHPKTYDFIRRCVTEFGIDLTCLRGNFNQDVGQGHTYNVVPLNEINHDMLKGPYAQMMRKYGVPTIASAWCTSRMKEETHDKYCDDKYGKGNYVTWLGIRADEPRRLKIGANPNLRYMAEITDFEKQDILNFWRGMDFDLEIDEHLGNCVFCFKKAHGKVALAARDEPELLKQWEIAIEHASDRLSQPIVKDGGLAGKYVQHVKKGVMHRGRRSIGDIIHMFSMLSTDDLREHVYRNIKDSGTCSESCEAFAQGDMFDEYTGSTTKADKVGYDSGVN